MTPTFISHQDRVLINLVLVLIYTECENTQVDNRFLSEWFVCIFKILCILAVGGRYIAPMFCYGMSTLLTAGFQEFLLLHSWKFNGQAIIIMKLGCQSHVSVLYNNCRFSSTAILSTVISIIWHIYILLNNAIGSLNY